MKEIDLQFASTDELVEELLNRSASAVIIICPKCDELTILEHGTGSARWCIGAIAAYSRVLHRKVKKVQG